MKNNKNKLWQKDWELNAFVENFETKDDILLDQKLTFYDVISSMAHAQMLNKIGILSDKDLADLNKGLREIYTLDQKGQFSLSMGDEDIHTKIENYLTNEYGDVGKKIHTGRSRNDQVLTALRLYTKNSLLEISEDLLFLAKDFMSFSNNYKDVAMPGYTHMQKAMPYTIGAWAESFLSGFIDDLELLINIINIIDKSPLGSAAGFGSTLNNDKELTSNLMGFNSPLKNDLYSQNSKGKTEASVISVLTSILFGLNKFSSDVLLFTTKEFDFFIVDPTLQTGSSIMPQKKNLDIAELIRSKIFIVNGHYNQILGITTNLISGYNRDTQDIKKPLIESLEVTDNTIQATSFLIAGIKPNIEKLKASITPELFATDKAIELVNQGIPFREAYQKVGGEIEKLKSEDFNVEIKTNFDYFTDKLNNFEDLILEMKKNQENCFNNLLNI